MSNEKYSHKIYSTAVVAVMAALSTVLMFLQFGLPIMPGFLQFDFSELPALMTAFAVSPFAGVAVSFLKNVLHLFVTSTGGVGEISNFLLSSAFVLPAGIFYHFHKTKSGAMIGSLLGAIVAGAVSFPVNYFITYPVYFVIFAPKEAIIGAYSAIFPALDTLPKCLICINIPLTMAKALSATLISLLIYKPLSPILKGKHIKKT